MTTDMNNVRLRFTSDSSNRRKGFQLTFFSKFSNITNVIISIIAMADADAVTRHKFMSSNYEFKAIICIHFINFYT